MRLLLILLLTLLIGCADKKESGKEDANPDQQESAVDISEDATQTGADILVEVAMQDSGTPEQADSAVADSASLPEDASKTADSVELAGDATASE